MLLILRIQFIVILQNTIYQATLAQYASQMKYASFVQRSMSIHTALLYNNMPVTRNADYQKA